MRLESGDSNRSCRPLKTATVSGAVSAAAVLPVTVASSSGAPSLKAWPPTRSDRPRSGFTALVPCAKTVPQEFAATDRDSRGCEVAVEPTRAVDRHVTRDAPYAFALERGVRSANVMHVTQRTKER